MREMLSRMGALLAAFVVFPAAAQEAALKEDYVREPMPPGFSVVHTDVDGPVFTDSRGRTLYNWPQQKLRVGIAGEQQGKPSCYDVKQTKTLGFMSPYPPDLLLPELESRPTCVQVWPPVIAGPTDAPIGKWTILQRTDGLRQWAYDDQALYTSVLDNRPGEVNGGAKRETDGDAPAVRKPVGPPPNVPAAFAVRAIATGRLLTTRSGFSVYTWDGDVKGRSNCHGDCEMQWPPMLAAESTQTRGEWGVIERFPGVKQWTYRGRPLYTRAADRRARSLEGQDIHGWHNVYTQHWPALPEGFTIQDAHIGQVVADKAGRTIYTYQCGDDAFDQLACDHPTTTQVYRLAVCGNGDVSRCLKTFPYVLAADDAISTSIIWGVMTIDPLTGREVEKGTPGSLRVWAFRNRPVYTHVDDTFPGEVNGDAWGEFNGHRNGYKAFWVRDDFLSNAD